MPVIYQLFLNILSKTLWHNRSFGASCCVTKDELILSTREIVIRTAAAGLNFLFWASLLSKTVKICYGVGSLLPSKHSEQFFIREASLVWILCVKSHLYPHWTINRMAGIPVEKNGIGVGPLSFFVPFFDYLVVNIFCLIVVCVEKYNRVVVWDA